MMYACDCYLCFPKNEPAFLKIPYQTAIMPQSKSFQRIDPVYLWLIFLLVVASILRFYHYAAFSFSNDELSAINRLRFNTFHELVDKGFYVDGHPGGIQVMLWYWVKLFGVTEASLRLPFVIFGIFSVLLAFLIGKRLFGEVAGLFAATALTFLEFPLLYSQIARPYGSGLFFGLLMTWFWIRVIENTDTEPAKKRYLNLAGFTLGVVLCMYNHYFSFLLAVIVGIAGVFIVKRNRLPQYIIAGLLACLLFLPHLYITLNHLTYKGVGLWLGKPSPSWIPDHLVFIFNNQWWLLVISIMVAAILAWLNRNNLTCNKFRVLMLVFFLAPMLTGYIYSLAVNPVLQHPVLIFSFPFLLLFIFSFAGEKLTRLHSAILALFLLAGIFSTVVYGRYYHKQHFGEFKDVAARISQASKTYGYKNLTNVVSANNPYYLQYYFDRQQDSITLDMTNITADSLESLGRLVRNCGTAYLSYSWTKPSPPEAVDMIMASYPYIVDNKDYEGLSSFTLFARNKPATSYQADQVISTSLKTFDEAQPDVPPEKINQLNTQHGSGSFSIDSVMEYGPNIKIPLQGIDFQQNLRVVSDAWVYFDKLPTAAVFVVSLEIPGNEPLIWKGALIRDYADAFGWYKVRQTFTLPEKPDNGAVLKTYIWNKGKENFLVDEMKLSVEKIK